MNLLFVNCCVRGEESRTLRLCRAALDEIGRKYDGVTVDELCLDGEDILPLNSTRLAARHSLEEAGQFDDPMFRYARQFAQADLILVGAPYWEYQFPALLRCYLEQVSVCGVTFRYTEDGRPEGLCRADRLFYLTTTGGPILDKNCGFDYIKTLCGSMFGMSQIDYTAAECLDVWGVDVEATLQAAEKTLRAKIQSW